MSEYKRGIGQVATALRTPVVGEVVQLRFITDGDQLVKRVVHPRTKGAARVECKRRLNLAEEYIDPVLACDACTQGRIQEVILYAWVQELRRVFKGVSTEAFRPKLLSMRGQLASQVMSLYYSTGSLVRREYSLSRRGAKYELIPVEVEPELQLPQAPTSLDAAVDKELGK